ncbi:MAG: hypothetical protein J4G05_03230 [Chlorobi bacterium]|nr:hypothetical protein [Chlorobiota bacterium]
MERALSEAFPDFIEKREVSVILFSSMTAFDLAEGIIQYPVVLKPLIAACNIAARAIERDIGIKNLNTYEPRLTRESANIIAGYIKPFLPEYLEIPSLGTVDRVAFVDKEMRKNKGNWERKISSKLKKHAGKDFKKRKFTIGGEVFELDAAYPATGDVQVGIDVKRIEARRDIHKRCDEIVNKARKLKEAFPDSKFAAAIYYPFIDEHVNIQHRLYSDDVDCVVFASDGADSIRNAVWNMIGTLKI